MFAAATPENEVYTKYVGKQAIDCPSAEGVSKDSVFWVCSMTKLVVTVGQMNAISADVLPYIIIDRSIATR